MTPVNATRYKICMLGAFAVGKTSLVARFVQSPFSDAYHTTVGVKIDKKLVAVRGREVMLMLWDLAGEDELNKVNMQYLRGAAAYLLVCDGTRRDTLETAARLRERVESAVGPLPFLLAVNKADLAAEWEVTDVMLDPMADDGWTVVKASAKTGQGVEGAFLTLAERIMAAAEAVAADDADDDGGPAAGGATGVSGDED